MARPAQQPETVQATKERILDAATDLIYRDGFDGLTMRKLAARSGMTAANIYNYYANKNEIYLEIQTRGFALLAGSFEEVCAQCPDPMQRLIGLVRAYVNFGITHPDHYDVMLGRNTPKYADYVDTELEPLARREKDIAITVIDLAEQAILEALRDDKLTLPVSAREQALELWCTLHGLVSLRNARVLQEVVEDPEDIANGIVERIRATFVAQEKNS